MRILLWNEIKWQQIKKDRGERHQWKEKKKCEKEKETRNANRCDWLVAHKINEETEQERASDNNKTLELRELFEAD